MLLSRPLILRSRKYRLLEGELNIGLELESINRIRPRRPRIDYQSKIMSEPIDPDLNSLACSEEFLSEFERQHHPPIWAIKSQSRKAGVKRDGILSPASRPRLVKFSRDLVGLVRHIFESK